MYGVKVTLQTVSRHAADAVVVVDEYDLAVGVEGDLVLRVQGRKLLVGDLDPPAAEAVHLYTYTPKVCKKRRQKSDKKGNRAVGASASGERSKHAYFFFFLLRPSMSM